MSPVGYFSALLSSSRLRFAAVSDLGSSAQFRQQKFMTTVTRWLCWLRPTPAEMALFLACLPPCEMTRTSASTYREDAPFPASCPWLGGLEKANCPGPTHDDQPRELVLLQFAPRSPAGAEGTPAASVPCGTDGQD